MATRLGTVETPRPQGAAERSRLRCNRNPNGMQLRQPLYDRVTKYDEGQDHIEESWHHFEKSISYPESYENGHQHHAHQQKRCDRQQNGY